MNMQHKERFVTVIVGKQTVTVGRCNALFPYAENPSLNELQERLMDMFGIPVSHQILVYHNMLVDQRVFYSLLSEQGLSGPFMLFMRGTSDQNLIDLCKDLKLNESVEELISLPPRIKVIPMKINAGTTVLDLKEHIQNQTGIKKEHQLIAVIILSPGKETVNPCKITEPNDFLIDLFFSEGLSFGTLFHFKLFLDISSFPDWRSMYYESYSRYNLTILPSIIIMLNLGNDQVVETQLPRFEIKTDSIDCINRWIEQQYNIPCQNQLLLFRGKILQEYFLDTITSHTYIEEPDTCRVKLYNTDNFPEFINLQLNSGDHRRITLSSLANLSYEELKIWIEITFNIKPVDQVLMHNGKELVDDATFFECLHYYRSWPTIQLHVLPKRSDDGGDASLLENEFRILKPIQVVNMDNQPLPMRYFYTRNCNIHCLKASIQSVLSVNSKSKVDLQFIWNGDVIKNGGKLFLEIVKDLNFTENNLQLLVNNGDNDNSNNITNNNKNNNNIIISLLTKCSNDEAHHVTSNGKAIPFNIIVYHPNNSEIIFKTHTNVTSRVADIKNQLAVQFSLDVCDQIILFGGKILQTDQRFSTILQDVQNISRLVDLHFETVIPLALFLKPTLNLRKYEDFCTRHKMISLRTVTVTSLTGQTTIFNVGERIIHLTKCLKFEIQKEMHVPRHIQKLMFNNKELEDKQSLMEIYLDVAGDFATDNTTIFLVISKPLRFPVLCHYKDECVGPLLFSETASMAKVKEKCVTDLVDKGAIREPSPFKCYQCIVYGNRRIDDSRFLFEFITMNDPYMPIDNFCMSIQKKVFVLIRFVSTGSVTDDIELDFPITDNATQTISTIRKYLIQQNFVVNKHLVLDNSSGLYSLGLKTKLDDIGDTIIVFKAVKSHCTVS